MFGNLDCCMFNYMLLLCAKCAVDGCQGVAIQLSEFITLLCGSGWFLTGPSRLSQLPSLYRAFLGYVFFDPGLRPLLTFKAIFHICNLKKGFAPLLTLGFKNWFPSNSVYCIKYSYALYRDFHALCLVSAA